MNCLVHKAFTLIELLVVVAIVAILSAIGIINLQHAQARAKLSRVEADVAALRTALEAYRVDNRAYPPAAYPGGDLLIDVPLVPLTTPVAFITSLPADPFGEAGFNFAPEMKQLGYFYKDRASTSIGMSGETFLPVWQAMAGKEYLIHSCGPNRVWDVFPYEEYDPTNGVVSCGDIARFGP